MASSARLFGKITRITLGTVATSSFGSQAMIEQMGGHFQSMNLSMPLTDGQKTKRESSCIPIALSAVFPPLIEAVSQDQAVPLLKRF